MTVQRICISSLLSLITVAFAGCARDASPPSQPAQQSQQPQATADAKQEHSHGAGPHGGTITDWGGGTYHVEFTVDHDKKEATVYIFGSDGKSPAPVKADKIQLSINDPAFQIDLAAQPLQGEGEGKSSRFVGKHVNLGIVREFEGTISGQVEATPYVGEFKEVAGDHKH